MPETLPITGRSVNSTFTQSEYSPFSRTTVRSTDPDADGIAIGIQVDGEGDRGLARSVSPPGRGRRDEGVDRSPELGLDPVILDLHVVHGPAGDLAVELESVGGVVAEGPVGVDEVGRSHARDGPGGGLVDREVGGDLPDPGWDASLGEVGPERLPTTQGRRPTADQGEVHVPEVHGDAGRVVLEDGEDGQVRGRVASDEVADAVAPRRLAGDEARPGHRAEGRHGRGERAERPHLGQLPEVREVTAGHQATDDSGVESVEGEHDGLAAGGAAPRAASQERRGQAGGGPPGQQPDEGPTVMSA